MSKYTGKVFTYAELKEYEKRHNRDPLPKNLPKLPSSTTPANRVTTSTPWGVEWPETKKPEAPKYTEEQLSKRCMMFAYGSNMNGDQIKTRASTALRYSNGTLNKYAFRFVGRGVASVVKNEASSVPGVLYTLEFRDLLAMHVFEGVPWVYKCKLRKIDTNKGPKNAWVYIHTNRDWEKPAESYILKILEGAHDAGIEDSYLWAAYKTSVAEYKKRIEEDKRLYNTGKIASRYASTTWWENWAKKKDKEEKGGGVPAWNPPAKQNKPEPVREETAKEWLARQVKKKAPPAPVTIQELEELPDDDTRPTGDYPRIEDWDDALSDSVEGAASLWGPSEKDDRL